MRYPGLGGAAAGLAFMAATAHAALPDCARHGTDEMTCLACNIYHEARGESLDGQLAVAMVTLNRLRASGYPKTICEVVWERGRDARSGRMVAQFSWTLDDVPDRIQDAAAWARAQGIAQTAVRVAHAADGTPDPSQGATHFHASYVDPDWSRDRDMAFVRRIGTHLFYRSAGRYSLAGGTLPPALPEGRPAAVPEGVPTDVASWVKRGARLISLAPAQHGGALQVTVSEGERVRQLMVRRERP